MTNSALDRVFEIYRVLKYNHHVTLNMVVFGMAKQFAELYVNEHVNDEIPKKIFDFFKRLSKVMDGEPVLAIFESISNSSSLAENSAIVLKDRIEYAETNKMFPKMKSVSLNFIDQIYLLSEGDLKFVSITDKAKSSIRFEIRSSITNTTNFYQFLKDITRADTGKSISKTVRCKNCGASTTIYKDEEVKCPYCETPISWL